MNRKAVDMAGQRFNRWTVVARAANSPSGQIRWLCRCDCGTEAVVQSGALKSDHSKSCGCHKVETTIRRSTKHGHATGGVISPVDDQTQHEARTRDRRGDFADLSLVGRDGREVHRPRTQGL